MYAIQYRPAAIRDMKKLEKKDMVKIQLHIERLANNPYPHGSLKMSGEDQLWRIRVGDYRVVYRVHEDVLVVLVVAIGHRREVYR